MMALTEREEVDELPYFKMLLLGVLRKTVKSSDRYICILAIQCSDIPV